MRLWSVVEKLQAHLEDELGTEVYQRLWEQGTQADWETVAEDVIRILEDDPIPIEAAGDQLFPDHILTANENLIKPLSMRELEVLHKITEGLTNRQIADELYIGVGTVKKHITHIYGKLQVDNRTQAIRHARDIHIV